MSADGAVELDWGGDHRKFRLGIDELLSLQRLRDCGPLAIATRLRDGTWWIEDVIETIRIALMGGGLEGKAARTLVSEQIRPGQITSNVLTAYVILIAALQGDENDPVGKDGATAPAPAAVTSASLPPPSTETALE